MIKSEGLDVKLINSGLRRSVEEIEQSGHMEVKST